MKRKGRTGSALILVMISAIVLSILVGALYTLFHSNSSTQAWAMERIQARFTAEAGMNLAVHMIVEAAYAPQGTMPIQFLPETGDWYDLGDDMGWVLVFVDPHNSNDEVATANAYEVRCLSKVISEDQVQMYGIASLILPKNFSVYATFLDNISNDYLGDRYRLDGPFHSNNAVQLSSSTTGREHDPWFYSLAIATEHYLYRIPGTGITEIATLPHHKNLYIEPYEKMLMGEPFFELGVDEIPLNSNEVGWQGAYNAALSGGLMLSGLEDGTRMILLDSLLLVKENETSLVQTYDLSLLTNPVVWVNNGSNETVYLKTEEDSPLRNHGLCGLPDGLTIGVNGNLCVSGPILYKNIDLTDDHNDCILGLLVKEGNFTIAVDPDMVSALDDWVVPMDAIWDISTSNNDYTNGIEIDAVIMVLDGHFELENTSSTNITWWPNPAAGLQIVGSYIVNQEGVITWDFGTDTFGYKTSVTYDPRLMTMHPPYFPNTGVWDTAYWDERPDMIDQDDGTNNYIGRDRI
ncbi:MAG: hypothetical protein KAR44_08515 [Candidatus Aegiribacteria sp.]|nr:hypothetical protein [Candidatus Aegiribacteria sp.]